MTCREAGYDANDRWHTLPTGRRWNEATAVAVDSQDRVVVFNRGEHPVLVFAPDGTLIRSWGAGRFTRPHGITIAPDGSFFLTDDGGHAVYKCSPEGEILLTLGTPGRGTDTGVQGMDFRTIRQPAGPFHYPCNVALASGGEIAVCDGYGNARIHIFSPQGKLLHSWGEPGDGPGQFRIPHGIAIDDRDIVWVADRENSRIQRFTLRGEFIDEWRDIARPCELCIRHGRVYVAELGYKAGMWPGTNAPSPDATSGRVSIFDLNGKLLARFGGGTNPTAPGDFFAPHDIAVDSRGAIYVAEVTLSAGGNRGLVSPDCHSLQKFTPRG
jgi:streptogramin lyase